MKDRRDEDEKNRSTLYDFLQELKRILLGMDIKIKNHVYSEYGATQPRPDIHIDNLSQQMKYPQNKLVVAGICYFL